MSSDARADALGDRVVEHFSFPNLLGLFRQLGFM
jgi:hypothetical protein